MTDTEKSQLRQDLLEQFRQMMADDQPIGAQDYANEGQSDWSSQH